MKTLLTYGSFLVAMILISLVLVKCKQSGDIKNGLSGNAEKITETPSGGPLSPAMERAYNYWPTKDDRENEFYTNFKYSYISGIGKDPEVSRRDPSKIIRHNGKYYVWYTRRKTEQGPAGMDNGTDEIPSVDWDLADIYYATSEDGFNWTEQGVAVPRTPKGQYGDRAATTTDILVYKGKYYLFYQTFTGPFSSKTGDHCDVSIARADSPDGPWTRGTEPIIPLGGEEDWDGGAIHDPYPLVYKDKIWLFYKGQPSKLAKGARWLVRAQGVAIADNPEGPYIKPEINPILNSGHETCLFPWEEGIAAILSIDGPEKNTVQYADDGINFRPMAAITVPPIAPGAYVPDAFLNNGDGKGITWGLSHVNVSPIDPTNYRRIVEQNSFLIRFDCDLHRDFDLPYFKNPRDQVGRFSEETFFQPKMVLEEHAKKEVLERMKSIN
jgi:hypothetical protein